MTAHRRTERDDAPDAMGPGLAPRVSLAGIALVTVAIAVVAALISIPLRNARERGMVEAARSEMDALVSAVERFRAEEYRLPDSVEDLGQVGYTKSPAIEICVFEHVPDPRQFEDHVSIVLRHRASARAVSVVHPTSDRLSEVSADDACGSTRTQGAST